MRSIIATLLFIPMFASANMIVITPESYSFDQATGSGAYSYHDWTGKQLIDGEYGEGVWSTNKGNGPAYEWVGWSGKPLINIDFSFSTTRTFQNITLSTQQAGGGLRLPSWSVFAWENASWSLKGDYQNPRDETYTYYDIDQSLSSLNFTADKVRIQLRQSGSPHWIFTDEITFRQNQSQTLFDIQNFGANDVNAISYLSLSFLGLFVMRRRMTKNMTK